ncbi:MAG: hypothetical protein DRH17_02955 [Deltaproteobacteria bacterium]|nr:MAG: hypothetical protein DRH17_02955 [Deltaproteobacteria bacterium]
MNDMNEKKDTDELRAEIERGHFARAALVAASLGLPAKEIQDFRFKALWQMSAVYRNAPGTKKLAQQYRFSKQELRQLLEKTAEEQKNEGNDRPLKLRYDHSTGKYLTFEEWMNLFFRNWNKW